MILADFYDDFCTIRRDMVAFRLLGRDKSRYWRIRPAQKEADRPRS